MNGRSLLKKIVRNGSMQLFLFTLIPFIVHLIFKRNIIGFPKAIGLHLPDNMSSVIIALLLLIAVRKVFRVIRKLLPPLEDLDDRESDPIFEIRDAGKSKETILAVLFLGLITTGLSEEILFRGFFAKGLINIFGFILGNSLQSIVFALLHALPQYKAQKSIVHALVEFLRVFFIAFTMGYIMVYVSAGSILPLYLYHGVGNIIGFYKMAFPNKEVV